MSAHPHRETKPHREGPAHPHHFHAVWITSSFWARRYGVLGRAVEFEFNVAPAHCNGPDGLLRPIISPVALPHSITPTLTGVGFGRGYR